MKKFLCVVVVCISSALSPVFPGWGQPPAGWDDFQFGVVDANVDPWKSQLVKALDLDSNMFQYRYRYCNEPGAVDGYLFTEWFNFANGPKGIRPSMTIYMLLGNLDDLSVLQSTTGSETFMKSYFDAIGKIVEYCKGKKPILVVEPDVWGYFFQNDMAGYGDKYLNLTCRINDIGIPGLTGFQNKIADLPGAIVAHCKSIDPECYVGILMNHWGTNSFWLPSPEANATNTLTYLNKLLRAPYKGDFIAVEKYGSDAGSVDKSVWMWNDTKNADFVTWCKTLAQGVDLPICGWQTSIGYENGKEAGYPDLPNTANRYEDTFFPYFFRHVNDFIDAGFIGYLATCNNQAQGTVYGFEVGEYDNGYFIDRMTEFNSNRPYNLNLGASPITVSQSAQTVEHLNVTMTRTGMQVQLRGVNPLFHAATISLYTLSGKVVRSLRVEGGKAWAFSVAGLSNGAYIVAAESDDGSKRISQSIPIGQ